MTDEVILPSGKIAKALDTSRPSLVMDEDFTEPGKIYSGDFDGLWAAARELDEQRRNKTGKN